MNKYSQSEGGKDEKAQYPPYTNLFSLVLALIVSLIFFSCGNLQENNSTDIAIHIPVEQLANASYARAVSLADDPSVYGVELTLYVNDIPRTQSAQGTLLELSQKIFVFEELPVGAMVKAQAKVTKDGVLAWSGESQIVALGVNGNDFNIEMKAVTQSDNDSEQEENQPTHIHVWSEGVVAKEATLSSEGEMIYTCTVCGETKTETISKLSLSNILLANKKINNIELFKTSEVVVLPKGKSLTIKGTESSGMFRTNRTVTLTRAFAMGQYEVTQELFEAVMSVNPSSFNGSSGKEPANGEIQKLRPVEQVSWYDAIAFCNKLSILCGLDPCYSVSGITDWESLSYSDIPDSEDTNWNAPVCDWTKNGYRLPTGTEWEFAARGGNPDATAWGYTYAGGNDFENLVWSGDNSGNKTHEVGLKKGNTLGLYDMSGNVNERCWDVWASGVIETGTFTDPTGATTGNRRLWRGGGWSGAAASYCKLSYIATCSWDLSSRNNLGDVGIRLCRTITSD